MTAPTFILENKDRINLVIERASMIGDAGPVIGTILALIMTDAEFETFVNADVVGLNASVTNAAERAMEAGIIVR